MFDVHGPIVLVIASLCLEIVVLLSFNSHHVNDETMRVRLFEATIEVRLGFLWNVWAEYVLLLQVFKALVVFQESQVS